MDSIESLFKVWLYLHSAIFYNNNFINSFYKLLYDIIRYFSGSGNYSADSAICAMLLPDMPRLPLYELSCIVFFLIPMLVILVVYTRMGLKIKSSTKKMLGPIQGFVHGDSRQTQSRKSIRMLSMMSSFLLLF